MKRGARVVLNRRALDGVSLAIADGLHAVGMRYLAEARTPDAPPYGEGLVKAAGTITFANGRKVAGWGADGKQPRKPRAFRAPKPGLGMVAGWGFPARLVAFGTVDTPAHGWAHQALSAIEPRIPGIIRQAAAYRIKRLRG